MSGIPLFSSPASSLLAAPLHSLSPHVTPLHSSPFVPVGGGEVAAAEFSVKGVKGRIDRSVTVFTVNAVESNIHHIPSRTLGKKDEEGERRMKKEEEGGRRRKKESNTGGCQYVISCHSAQRNVYPSKYNTRPNTHTQRAANTSTVYTPLLSSVSLTLCLSFTLSLCLSVSLPLRYAPPWDANRLRIDDTGPTPPTAKSRPLREGDESSIAVSTAEGAD